MALWYNQKEPGHSYRWDEQNIHVPIQKTKIWIKIRNAPSVTCFRISDLCSKWGLQEKGMLAIDPQQLFPKLHVAVHTPHV